jgi:hypothetical protein
MFGDNIGLEAALITLSQEQKAIRETLATIATHLEYITERVKQYARRDGLISNKV